VKAIVLAGGRGTRLAPWEAPKCLLPVNGLPILYRLLSHLADSGMTLLESVTICTGYRAADIERAVRTWKFESRLPIYFSSGDPQLTMIERVKNAFADPLWYPDEQPLLICYGDELTNVSLTDLSAMHRNNRAMLTFAAFETLVPGGAVVYGTHGPQIVESNSCLINIGFVIAEREALRYMPAAGGLSEWINITAAHTERVAVYHHEGVRATINSLADLRGAEEIWR